MQKFHPFFVVVVVAATAVVVVVFSPSKFIGNNVTKLLMLMAPFAAYRIKIKLL